MVLQTLEKLRQKIGNEKGYSIHITYGMFQLLQTELQTFIDIKKDLSYKGVPLIISKDCFSGIYIDKFTDIPVQPE